eukprot:TRINITY_DN4836_c0_g1_i4.p1 TRINITY_DN4836_c0_g1~~TRINITY_DN4836_c0_g1_i4.p1  ORF type:complete len:131 (-),score=10.24 TRINITY_DN4836_c0_g1_i4:20-412(-)
MSALDYARHSTEAAVLVPLLEHFKQTGEVLDISELRKRVEAEALQAQEAEERLREERQREKQRAVEEATAARARGLLEAQLAQQRAEAAEAKRREHDEIARRQAEQAQLILAVTRLRLNAIFARQTTPMQ